MSPTLMIHLRYKNRCIIVWVRRCDAGDFTPEIIDVVPDNSTIENEAFMHSEEI